MRRENWIKKQITAGKPVFPFWVGCGNPAIAEAAVYSGWPVILIDNEHGTASLETTVHIVRAVESAGGHVIVRVPWHDPVYLKQILDLGVQSLMLPMIIDEKSAQNAVAACRYPPRGFRGYAAPIVRGSCYGANPDYAKSAHEDLLLIAQIEHYTAAENIEQIASVDGLDVLFIGPNDLAASMGHLEDLMHPEVQKAVAGIEQKIKASGKIMACMSLPGVSYEEEMAKGHKIIANTVDMGLFVAAARNAASRLPKLD